MAPLFLNKKHTDLATVKKDINFTKLRKDNSLLKRKLYIGPSSNSCRYIFCQLTQWKFAQQTSDGWGSAPSESSWKSGMLQCVYFFVQLLTFNLFLAIQLWYKQFIIAPNVPSLQEGQGSAKSVLWTSLVDVRWSDGEEEGDSFLLVHRHSDAASCSSLRLQGRHASSS